MLGGGGELRVRRAGGTRDGFCGCDLRELPVHGQDLSGDLSEASGPVQSRGTRTQEQLEKPVNVHGEDVKMKVDGAR